MHLMLVIILITFAKSEKKCLFWNKIEYKLLLQGILKYYSSYKINWFFVLNYFVICIDYPKFNDAYLDFQTTYIPKFY